MTSIQPEKEIWDGPAKAVLIFANAVVSIPALATVGLGVGNFVYSFIHIYLRHTIGRSPGRLTHLLFLTYSHSLYSLSLLKTQ